MRRAGRMRRRAPREKGGAPWRSHARCGPEQARAPQRLAPPRHPASPSSWRVSPPPSTCRRGSPSPTGRRARPSDCRARSAPAPASAPSSPCARSPWAAPTAEPPPQLLAAVPQRPPPPPPPRCPRRRWRGNHRVARCPDQARAACLQEPKAASAARFREPKRGSGRQRGGGEVLSVAAGDGPQAS